jgi:wyosine [tRNA(Phe)-imidazoG37] synthetase (radical SAM superfamily)
VGRTTRLRDDRSTFRGTAAVVAAVEEKVESARAADEWIDYLTFVPDGEPTLDRDIGEMIRALLPLGIPVAVVTNGSLLARRDVRDALMAADYISVKVDAVEDHTWRSVNRPHGRLELSRILGGLRTFAARFPGQLVTETMLLDGVNDDESELRATASFIGDLSPAVAYLSVPTRPPAEPWVRTPSPAAVTGAYEVFRALAGRVELLVGYEGDAFTPTGDPREDLLAITAVHPMREGAVVRLLNQAGGSPSLVSDLVREEELVEVMYGGHRYYLRPLSAPAGEE